MCAYRTAVTPSPLVGEGRGGGGQSVMFSTNAQALPAN